MKRRLQNSIRGPLLILFIAALVIAYSWYKNQPAPATSAAVKTTDATLPRSVLHYPACDPAKEGKDCDKPVTTPCYAGPQYEKFVAALKARGLAGIATGKLADGRQLVVYQGAADSAFILLAIGQDNAKETEACQLGGGQNWRNGTNP